MGGGPRKSKSAEERVVEAAIRWKVADDYPAPGARVAHRAYLDLREAVARLLRERAGK